MGPRNGPSVRETPAGLTQPLFPPPAPVLVWREAAERRVCNHDVIIHYPACAAAEYGGGRARATAVSAPGRPRERLGPNLGDKHDATARAVERGH